MPSTNTVVACLATAALCLVGVTVAGPLNPPAGPVTPTDPDLGQILSAVQGGDACCGNAAGEPGGAEQVRLTLNGFGTFDVHEYDASYFIDTTGPGGASLIFSNITVTRPADAQTAPIIAASLAGSFFTGSIDVGGGGGVTPTLSIEFTNAVVLGVENVTTTTCDGTRQAERLTIRPGTLRYSTSEGTISYNYQSGVIGS